MEQSKLGTNPLDSSNDLSQNVSETPTPEVEKVEEQVQTPPVEEVQQEAEPQGESEKSLVEITYEKALRDHQEENKKKVDEMIKAEMGEQPPVEVAPEPDPVEEQVEEEVNKLTKNQYEQLRDHFGERVNNLETENTELKYQVRRDEIELGKLREDVERLIKENVDLKHSNSRLDDETLFFSNLYGKIKENPEDEKTISKALDYMSLKVGEWYGVDPQFVRKTVREKVQEDRNAALDGFNSMNESYSSPVQRQIQRKNTEPKMIDPTKIPGFKGIPG